MTEIPAGEAPPEGIEIHQQPRGRFSVFAARVFAAGETIERAPVIDFPKRDWKHVTQTALAPYSFSWDERGEGALALGYGALYSRSATPIARCFLDVPARVLEIVAARDIAAGHEITITGEEGLLIAAPAGIAFSPPSDVVWGESPARGRGVFAARALAAGETIERSPCITFAAPDWKPIEKSRFDDYCFVWGEDRKSGALPLGYGSLYNHSFQPNATYVRHLADQVMDFVAIRDIAAGEEIRTNYNRDPLDQSPVWFDVVP